MSGYMLFVVLCYTYTHMCMQKHNKTTHHTCINHIPHTHTTYTHIQ